MGLGLAPWFSVGLKLWLAGLGALLTWRILRGGIPVDGLFREAIGEPISPERVALFLAFPVVLGQWVLASVGSRGDIGSVSDLPPESLGVLAAFQGLYLGGKGWRRFKRLGRMA